jgi:class 3 adenylate cyclase/predicted ATPase
MDVGGWLRRLGLDQYEAAFRENAISEKVLPNLTAEDLKDLGVGMVGHRRMLLDAIAALRAETSAPTPLPEAPLATDKAAKDTAERRQVTVMFSDLVGSTALAARMDPEDLRDIISAYHRCVADTVGRFRGFVAKYMGDGVLVYFGYPQAHEDDAERAVRAGLELVTAIGDLKTHAALQMRVGIATGLVVVGDLIGSGASQEQAIVGDTPNLAARLQGIAEPSTVVIAEATRGLLGNLFELRDLGPKDLKGIAGSVRAFAALRVSSVESRFEAMHPSGLTELVGREEELELLLRRWAKAKTSEGQVVLLSGEAGIGKSRLTVALLERLATEPHARLRYFCSPHHTDSALYPIISQMERAARFTHDDTAQAKLDKLDALLAQSATSRQDAALFAEMLSLPNDGRYAAAEMNPQQRRQKTMEALTAQIEALGRRKPVLLILEDAHWTDPTSLEVFGRAMEQIRTLGVLLIVTYRPGFHPPWIGGPHVTALTLNRLGERETVALIDGVAGKKQLPASLRQEIIERADGIPLFLEEITRSVLEAADEGTAERAVTAILSPSVAIPASLHASLMARLDRLGTAKELAQIGAAIGREFSHALLDAAAGKPESELNSALDRLIGSGLLFRRGAPPHATYVFKHALVQTAAYGTLLREPRRALHAKIAKALEGQFPDLAESYPEVVARHYTEAGLIEGAASLWGKAGQRSLDRSALIEAAEQIKRALAQIVTLPANPKLRRDEIKLQLALANALMHTTGYGAPETRAALDRARALIELAETLGETLEDPLAHFSLLYGYWVAKYAAFDGEAVRTLAAQFLSLAETQSAKVPLMIGHRIMGLALVETGDVGEGCKHLDRALALYDGIEDHLLATRFGQDSRLSILACLSRARWLLGYPEAALEHAELTVRLARQINPAGLLYALGFTALTHLWSGNYGTAGSQFDELYHLAEEKSASLWRVVAVMFRGCLLALMGEANKAIDLLPTAISEYCARGTTLWLPWVLACLAKAFSEVGKFDDACRHINEALTILEIHQARVTEAEVHRVAGEIALMSPERDAANAEACFERALAVARQRQARSWELRAAMSMARLWRSQGKSQQARELLAPVYGWFTEGFDTRDLKEAKVLLGELASTNPL